MKKSRKTYKQCRYCALLESKIWLEKESFRCSIGRFDDKFGDVYFSWSGICRPNKTVAAAQRDCLHFKITRKLNQ